ncbi:MAG: gamma-glutamyltransferase [Pirellulaceae bacterium]|nr:gamma-glutamyltransferase [Pirellulaceae bacterium]
MRFTMIHRRNFLAGATWAGSAFCLAGRGCGEDVRDMYASARKVASGARGCVATSHPLATRAAMERLQQGGNAIDAAVAASLMLSVVDGHNSGIGGGGLALLRLADGQVLALDGRETAPRRSLPDHYRGSDGKPDSQLSQHGPLAVAVPGLLALLEQISRQHGVQGWQDSLLSAAQVAESGYLISDYFANVLKTSAPALRRFPASAGVLLDPGGQPWRAGDVLRQPDLARSLRKIADEGGEWFYRGEFADRLQAYMIAHNGWMRADDLAEYRVLHRAPIRSGYRGRQVVGFPPPSSGGIHIAQMLGMLEPLDVAAAFGQSEAAGLHLLLEVMKRALADRAYWLGDADFTKVPTGLLDVDYLRQRAADIDPERATVVTSHGQPPRADQDVLGRGGHTTHLTVADAQGNAVALTQTVNTSFGSKIILPGTGIVLNNQMDDFSLAAGVRNAFGLLGSKANEIVAGKRPLSSMSPTIVLDQHDRLLFTGGAAGGPRIITAVLQALVRTIDLGNSVDQALGSARVHHQWSPDQAWVEQAMPASVVSQLQQFGHEIQRTDTLAVAQAIQFEQSQMRAASDPRVPSAADAW